MSGLGFGVMSGVFSSINVLADSAGPGTVGLHGDSPYFFALSAFFTLAFVLLHVFWGIIFFKGVDAGNCNMIGYVLVTHLLVSLMVSLFRVHYKSSDFARSQSANPPSEPRCAVPGQPAAALLALVEQHLRGDAGHRRIGLPLRRRIGQHAEEPLLNRNPNETVYRL